MLGQIVDINTISKQLKKAGQMTPLVALAVSINSPGGTPATSSIIHKKIRGFAKEHQIPVYTFIEDLGASGGYYVACAGDKIYADENALVGSIGVVSTGFGLDKVLERFQIERRVFKSVSQKHRLDAFTPLKEEDVEWWQNLANDIGNNFKAVVESRRGNHLKNRERVFSGDVFTGNQALELGLIDGIGEAEEIIKKTFGKNVVLKPVTTNPFGFSMRNFMNPDTIVDRVLSSIEARIASSRPPQAR